VVIGGRTGVGKTRLLTLCDARIDLEGLAHHRGSAFGHHPQPQPTQIDFENSLSIALMKEIAADNRFFAVEDESRNIGSRHIPPTFFRRLEQAPLVLLEASDELRVEITLQEYVHDALQSFRVEYGDEPGFRQWSAYLQNSLNRIRRRLGGERHGRVSGLLKSAIERHSRTGDTEAHRSWIRYLLEEYYDGMYEYQLSKKTDRVVFAGEQAAVLDFLGQTYGIGTMQGR